MDSIFVQCNKSDYTVEYGNNPINLRNSEYALALKNICLWNSWHNISDQFKNNKFDFLKQGSSEWANYTIPDGNYTMDDLNAYFEAVGIDLKIQIVSALSRFELVPGQGCAVDLSVDDLHKLLGFEPGIYKERRLAQHVGNITRGVDVIFVHCDLVASSRVNAEKTDVIHAFVPTAPHGALINENTLEPIYRPISDRSEIHRFRIWITDQNNRPIDLNGERIHYTLLLKKIDNI